VQHAHLLPSELDDSPESSTTPELSQAEDVLYRTSSGTTWIPADACDLQLRICIVAHTVVGGHRGYKSTMASIGKFFYWDTMDIDVKTFCSTCLNCQSTIAGNKTPRPYGQALHATRPNEVLHMD
jgi:hypothetical protein